MPTPVTMGYTCWKLHVEESTAQAKYLLLTDFLFERPRDRQNETDKWRDDLHLLLHCPQVLATAGAGLRMLPETRDAVQVSPLDGRDTSS